MDTTITDIDAYIAQFSPEIQVLLVQMRETISQAAPDASEAIGYGIPTFKLEGNLVHFAGFKKHIGFYPGASGIAHFQDMLAGYVVSKGTVQFPLDKPLPLELVRSIVLFRVAENRQKAKAKKQLKTCPNGHRFYKSSDCPVCPICEAGSQSAAGFPASLAAPARRALEQANIATLEELSGYTEKEILALHGFGPASLPSLRQALAARDLRFKTP